MRILFSLTLIVLITNVHAQHFRIKNYSAGGRVFEISGVGNNPTTIAHLLKDPATYKNYLNSIEYNSISGNPGIQIFRNYYINAELYKNTPLSRFWKRYSIQVGFLLSNKLAKDGMAVSNQKFVYTSLDTTLYFNQYSLVQTQQFIGVNVGLNRRFRISNKLSFLTGLHFQESFTIAHKYKNQWDSTIFILPDNRNTKTTRYSDLKGKHFFQWQAMIPLALELDMYRKQFFIRLEVAAGIIRSQYRSKNFAASEAHGAGVWLIYQRR